MATIVNGADSGLFKAIETIWLFLGTAAAAAKSLQSCPTLCDPIDCSPPGSPIPGILQARTLEWVAISFSNAWKWKVKVKSLSCVQLFVTPRTAVHQASSSMGFSRQEYWSGVPSPSPNTVWLQLNEASVRVKQIEAESAMVVLGCRRKRIWRLAIQRI